ncbi:MAG: ABC transporter permease [Elainellaceae cyanobacterium]
MKLFWVELFRAELKRSWTELIRYPAEAIGGIVIITIVFYGLFLSARYMAGPAMQFGDRLDAVVVGYVLWTLTLFIISDISLNLQSEAQTGTLEQIFLSPFGASRIFLVRALASLTIRLTLITTILLILMGITGSRLQFPPTLVLPLVTILMAGYGLAFMMGACALLFKRVQQLLGLFQFGLLFLLATPVETWSTQLKLLGWMLPMIPSAGLLRGLMARGEALDLSVFALALVNGGVYFTLGMTIFRWAEQQAKRRGLLGSY